MLHNILFNRVCAIGMLVLVFNCAVVIGAHTYNQCQDLDVPGVGDILDNNGVYAPAAATLQDCMTKCDSVTGCIGAIYYNGQCFLKNANVLTVAVFAFPSTVFIFQGSYSCPPAGSSFVSTLYTTCANLDTPSVGDLKINNNYGEPLPTIDACMLACNGLSGCIGAVYYNGNCWAKSNAVLSSPVVSLSNAIYFIPGDYGCPAVGNTFASSHYIQCPGIDNPTVGNINIPGGAGQVMTAGACMQACDSAPGCIGAVYDKDKKCWPKGTDILTTAVASASNSVYFITLDYGCPAVGNTVGSTKYIQCPGIDNPSVGNFNINGGGPGQVMTAGDCMQACTSVPGCIGAVYDQEKKCWPKGSDIITTPVAGISSANYFVSNAYGCPTAGQTFISTKYVVCADLDTPSVGNIGLSGTSEAAVDDCMEVCSTTSGCIGGLYYDGLCFPKSSAILGSATASLYNATYFINTGHSCPSAGDAFN